MSWTGRTLDSIVKADGTQISYTYDLDGIRTKKTVNGITTEYFVSGTTILAQKIVITIWSPYGFCFIKQ